MLPTFEETGEGDLGTRENRSIWVLGIEPGDPAPAKKEAVSRPPSGARYSVERQWCWRFNRNAFRLLAGLRQPADAAGLAQEPDPWAFAQAHRPFEGGSKGFFKGNLYPLPAKGISEWSDRARTDAGGLKKREYCAEIEARNWPRIRDLVAERRPELVIGVGLTHADKFRAAVLDASPAFAAHRLSTGKLEVRRIATDQCLLVVIPHLSWGLHGKMAIKEAASHIRGLRDRWSWDDDALARRSSAPNA